MSAQSPRSASRLPLVLGGCALVALCLCVLGGAAGYYSYIRSRPVAAEPAVEYLLDASPRMAQAAEGGTRLAVAQAVLAEIVRPANPQVTAGLRVFGAGALAQPCADTQLLVPLALASQALISDRLAGLQAGAVADAAMAEAMIAAIRDLSSARGPHTLVVVTGGQDSCNPEAAQLIAAEARQAGIELELFVVGYQVPSGDAEAIRGLIDQTPNAEYLEAQDEAGLRLILGSIQQRVDNRGSLPLADLLATARAVAAVTPAATPAATGTPAPSVSLEAAGQSVLEQVVLPDDLQHELVVFAWPDALLPSDSLAPYAYPPFGLAPEPIAIAAESWFFWIDDFPNGKFEHPNRYVLVDRASGAVTVSDETWWPVLNGVGLWLDPDDYWNADHWVYDNFAGRPQDRTAGPARLARLLDQPPAQPAGIGVGLVLNGWLPGQPGGADLAADAQGMFNALSGFGLTTIYLGPAEDTNPNRAGELSAANLEGTLADLAGKLAPGDTLLLYASSHGGRSPGGSYIGAGVSAEQFAAMLSALDPGVDVVVILDFSYSGGFIDTLLPYSDRIITAADAKTPAAFDADHPTDPNPADRGSEFTSGFVEQWEALRANGESLQAALSQAAATGRSPADVLAELAYGGTLMVDSNALRGATFPRMVPVPGAVVVVETPAAPQAVVYGLFLVTVSYESGDREHFNFIKLPSNPTIAVRQGSVIFDGPDPWVDVVGELQPDGSFTAQGAGAVAGNPNVLVVFQGTLTSERLSGLYTMGADGQLPGGQSITYRVEGVKVSPAGAADGGTPDPEGAAQETVEAFVKSAVPAAAPGGKTRRVRWL